MNSLLHPGVWATFYDEVLLLDLPRMSVFITRVEWYRIANYPQEYFERVFQARTNLCHQSRSCYLADRQIRNPSSLSLDISPEFRPRNRAFTSDPDYLYMLQPQELGYSIR